MYKLKIYIQLRSFTASLNLVYETDDGTDVSKHVEVLKYRTFIYLCIHLVL